MNRPRVTPQSQTDRPSDKNVFQIVPLWVFLIGLAISAGAAWYKYKEVNALAEHRFRGYVEAVANHVNARLQTPLFGLHGVRSVYAANPSLTREQFRAVVASRDLAKEFPGVRGFGFVQYVIRSDLDAFFASEQADGAPQFSLRQLDDKSHDDLYIVKMMEPAANILGGLGTDMGSEANRRKAVQRAVNTGLPTMTAHITLGQADRKTPGALLFVPVYGQGAAPSHEDKRRASLRGLLFAPLVFADLMDGLPAARDGLIDFDLFDGPLSKSAAASTDSLAGSLPDPSTQDTSTQKPSSNLPRGTLLFDTDNHQMTTAGGKASAASQRETHRPRFSMTQELSFGGRELTLRVNSTPALEATFDRHSALQILLGGALLSALTALLLRQQATGRRRAEARALEMTADLRQAEANSRALMDDVLLQRFAIDQHAIVVNTDVQGKITFVNDRFCEVSGYSRAELLGQDHIMLNSGVHPHGFFKAMYRTIAAGKIWHGEICNRAKAGHFYWLDTTIVPVMDDDGKPKKYIAIRTDISRQKAAELSMQKSAEFIRKIVAQSPGCLYQFKMHADGRFSVPFASAGLRDLYGFDPEDVRDDATNIFTYTITGRL